MNRHTPSSLRCRGNPLWLPVSDCGNPGKRIALRNDSLRSLITLISIIMLLSCLFLSQSVVAAPAKITKVRISDTPEFTRLVFDLSGTIKDYHVSYHPSSTELVLDLSGVSMASSLPDPKNTCVKSYVSKITAKDQLRLNIALNDPIDPRIYTLQPSGNYGHRLVLDLNKEAGPSQDISRVIASLDNQSIQNNPLPTIQEKTAPPPASNSKSKTLKPQLVSPKKSSGPLMIMIDPGHGGKDPGAMGGAGNREKDIVLAISKILRDKFNQERGFKAQLTRERDVYIPLRQRLAIARRNKSDFFISIHADAYKNREVKGASVFALSDRGATSEMARWLAQKENESELLDGVYASDDKVLRSVLLDLSQTHVIATSLDAGRSILGYLSNVTHLHYRRVEQAAFVVLKSPDIPSLLVETGYISNPMQEKQLVSRVYQEKIASSIVAGIKDYFARHPGAVY